ncbi:MAG: alpha/beta hydrolase, partial [Acidobacteriota bacterium]
IDLEYEVGLRMADDSREVFLDVYPIARNQAHILAHLALESEAEDLLENNLKFRDRISVSHAIEREIPADEALSALLWRATPNRLSFDQPDDSRSARLELVYREPGDFRWQSIDSALLTVQSIDQFYSLWSVREGEKACQEYPLECHPETACREDRFDIPEVEFDCYGDARHQAETGLPDPAKRHNAIFVHGYNVSEEAAQDAARRMAQRLYWMGYRGNVLAFTWEGDELRVGGPVPTPFAPNVDNAFRSGLRFKEWVEGLSDGSLVSNLRATPENLDVLAHSLGNQVVYDAMRVFAVKRPEELFFNELISIEPAIWTESFFDSEPVTYTGLFDIVYSEDDLRRNSWAFWFNQKGHPAAAAVNSIVHSWAPGDFALWAMRVDDYLIRSRAPQAFLRPEADPSRVPVEMGLFDQSDLSNSLGAMLEPPDRSPLYGMTSVLLPVGTRNNNRAVVTRNIDATQYNWFLTSHSAFQADPFPGIWLWWTEAVALEIDTNTE